MIALLLVCVSGRSQEPASQQGKYSAAGLENDQEVERFYLSFKAALAREDKRFVASIIDYPIRVSLASGRGATIRNKTQFIQKYDAIFDQALKEVIEHTGLDDLLAKWSGVATPRGEIWFNGIADNKKNPDQYKIKITAINGVAEKVAAPPKPRSDR